MYTLHLAFHSDSQKRPEKLDKTAINYITVMQMEGHLPKD